MSDEYDRASSKFTSTIGKVTISLALDLGIDRDVIFYGHVSEPSELRSVYGASVASLSPGYVGLSVTQSLGFGVPMIVSRLAQLRMAIFSGR